MHIRNKRGQSTVEYILLVTAVVAVIIAFVTGNNSIFKTQITSTLNQTTNQINVESGYFAGSHNSPAGDVANPVKLDTANYAQ